MNRPYLRLAILGNNKSKILPKIPGRPPFKVPFI